MLMCGGVCMPCFQVVRRQTVQGLGKVVGMSLPDPLCQPAALISNRPNTALL